MKINIGSRNPVKINAVIETVMRYPVFHKGRIGFNSFETDSEVSEQPKSFEEIVLGASNRAKNAFEDCNYSFGIESGLAEIPGTITGYMDFCACAIYDGTSNSLGMSCGLEYPPEVVKKVLEDGLDVNQAFFKSGLTNIKKLGSSDGGAIGMLTNDRITRKDYTIQAIQMAIIPLENPNYYPR